ncbi:hypothetical protein ACEN33_10775 [Ruoffia sp. FAM 24228]|uniref:hypothetical protein n=1 Tax=Ruoffia sp. FAM 24228 TaxID=3259517 RepID=UPI00388B4C14
MMQKIQRFGGAMFVQVLLFSFAGIILSLAILFQNEMISRAANESDVLIIAITSSQARLLTRIAKYTIYFQTITIPYKNDEMVSFLPVS